MNDNQELRSRLVHHVVSKGNAPQCLRQFIKVKQQAPHFDTEAALNQILLPFSDECQQTEAQLAAKSIKTLSILDDAYPYMLKNIPDPPLLLFYSGELQTLQRPCISIVGSRSLTTYGRQTAKHLAGELAKLGFTIVSGLALGIDSYAHDAALEAKGYTIGVLGSGIDIIYPKEHRELARSMVHHQGVVLSEFSPGTTPRPFHFPLRNRIISGLSHATIVVEAMEKSGSLITARHCLDQGRELFAVPGPIHAPTSMGTNKLIYDGTARLLLSVTSILEELSPLLGMAANHESRTKKQIDDPISKKIYQRLDAFEPLPLDLLVAELDIDPGECLAKLVLLESEKLVESRPGQSYLRNPLVDVDSENSVK